MGDAPDLMAKVGAILKSGQGSAPRRVARVVTVNLVIHPDLVQEGGTCPNMSSGESDAVHALFDDLGEYYPPVLLDWGYAGFDKLIEIPDDYEEGDFDGCAEVEHD